jgi:hypothetical protein
VLFAPRPAGGDISDSRLLGNADALSYADKTIGSPTKVTLVRVPNGGIQPQVAVDHKGVVHLIYFSGDPKAGDIFYVRSVDGEKFSTPLRVNGRSASAIAIGNIRGAHLALGQAGRVHVAWMGSDKALPRAPAGASPMLYTRLDDAGARFEPERNIIQKAVGLDGGDTVAADGAGHVYVSWHAPEPGTQGEQNRCVWVAHSSDDGKTFAAEERANPDQTGACGCCGMRAFVDKQQTLYVLYRSATDLVHRDMYLTASKNRAKDFTEKKIDSWTVGACPMSSMAFTEGDNGAVAAWETNGQVYFSLVDTTGAPRPIGPPGNVAGRKHPAVAVNNLGETILVWTEGMGWNRGGSVAWQVFDKSGRPTQDRGRADGVPVWSLVAVFAHPDGRFTILY